ncbi:MAG: acetolactate synthase large subunit [Gemmatimonadetes bacterium]|nr:acetolactate synthase large subunit [Gemmatimonadota bacterium]
MTAAQLLVRCLENEGVRCMFGVPGEENIAVLDALLDSGVRFIQTRHEQGAAFMADVQGRLTGRAGVCLSTLGPGATNLLTAVADANMDRAPLVAITGQAATERFHKESHQVLDLVSLFRPAVKWNTEIVRPEILPEAVRKAFKVAQTEKPGATHIDLPEDVAEAEAPVACEPLVPQQPFPTEPLEAQVERAVKIISEARDPIVLAGNGLARGRASDALRRFAETLGIPVVETFMGKGSIPAAHPLALGTVGLQERDYVSCGLDRADVVICVGYDLVEVAPSHWNPERDKRIVHIDPSPAEVDAAYQVAVGVQGAIALSLAAIAERAAVRGGKDALLRTARLKEAIEAEFRAEAEDDAFPVKPQRLVRALREALGDEDILLSDVGAHKLWIARMYPCARPNTCIISNGFASMGIALPGAIGAKLLFPERRVLAACGDGGFLMNVQELETAVRAETPFVAVVFEDSAYGVIKWKQMKRYGRPAFVDFGNPDFVALAESFGCRGYRVTATGELASILDEALRQTVPAVVACPVDYGENLKLTERLGSWVCPM